jgi:hypothetical protein
VCEQPLSGPEGAKGRSAAAAHSEAEALHHEAQRHVAVAVRREAAAHVVERVVDLRRTNQPINQSHDKSEGTEGSSAARGRQGERIPQGPAACEPSCDIEDEGVDGRGRGHGHMAPHVDLLHAALAVER